MKDLVMVVDDAEISRLMLREILIHQYDVIEAESAEAALALLFEEKILPQAILLDIVMPGMSGFDMLKELRKQEQTKNIPVLIISAETADANEAYGIQLGASDYVQKPYKPDIVRARLASHVQLWHYQSSLEDMVRIKVAETARVYEQTMEVLATIIEYRNLESGLHVRRTCMLAQILVDHLLTLPAYHLLREFGNPASLVKASVLHDIGKICVPDAILQKPGKLTPEEYDVMKLHTVQGREIVERIAQQLPDDDRYLSYCREICESHHEKWNGTGYPHGLAGEAIPLSARIMAIVDVYDALVNKRCYKDAFTFEEAERILCEDSGTHFDPALVEAFLAVKEEFIKIETQFGD